MANVTKIPVVLMTVSFKLVRMPDQSIKVDSSAEGNVEVGQLHTLIGSMEDIKQRLLSRADAAQKSNLSLPRGPFRHQ